MSLDALSPDWLVYGLLALLAAAAVQDSVQLKISNYLSFGVMLLAFVAMAVVGPEVGLWKNFVIFGVTLFLGTLLFGRGILGGGDVKLLAATSLWFDFAGALRFFPYVMITGGILGLLMIAIRQFSWSDDVRQRVVILRKKGGIPYGVAIAIGCAFAVLVAQQAAERRSPLNNWNVPAARS